MSVTEATKPPLNSRFMVFSKWKLFSSSAPAAMPTNREEYTSLVISASTMAMMGGISAQKLFRNGLTASAASAASSAPSAKQGTQSSAATVSRQTKINNFPFFCMFFPPNRAKMM